MDAEPAQRSRKANPELPSADADEGRRQDEESDRDHRLGDRPRDVGTDDENEGRAERETPDHPDELGDLGQCPDAGPVDGRREAEGDERDVEGVHRGRSVRLPPGRRRDDRVDPEVPVVEQARVGNAPSREFGPRVVTAVEQHAGVHDDRAGPE